MGLLRQEERLRSHSEVSQEWGAGPREPMLENWPTTGHSSSTSSALGPHPLSSWREDDRKKIKDALHTSFANLSESEVSPFADLAFPVCPRH